MFCIARPITCSIKKDIFFAAQDELYTRLILTNDDSISGQNPKKMPRNFFV